MNSGGARSPATPSQRESNWTRGLADAEDLCGRVRQQEDAGGAVCPGRRPGCSPPPSLTPRLLSNPPAGARASTPTRPLQIQTTVRRAGAPRPPGQSDKRGRNARAGEDGARLPGATPGLAIGPGDPAPSRIKPGGIRTDAAADTRTRRRTAARLTAAETRTRPKGPLRGERTSGTWCPAAACGNAAPRTTVRTRRPVAAGRRRPHAARLPREGTARRRVRGQERGEGLRGAGGNACGFPLEATH